MATLTSTGVICSNGTLDGYYTGTAFNNTSYPLGSHLLMQLNVTNVNVNASTNVFTSNNAEQIYIWQGNMGTGSVAISGTWRSRGQIDNNILTYRVVLVQRTA